MARVQNPGKFGFVSDFLFVWWRTIADGVTHQTTRDRHNHWKYWCAYSIQCTSDPYLRQLSKCKSAVLLTGFAARVWTGTYGNGNQVKVQSVMTALVAISKTCQLVGEQSPVYETEGKYILPIPRLTEGFKRTDPPAIPQMVVPVEFAETAAKLGHLTENKRAQAVGNLTLIAFY